MERILFAATKADHLHHEQHPALTAITAGDAARGRDRADFAGARDDGDVAGRRCAPRSRKPSTRDGDALPAVRGRLLSTGKPAVMYPGALPSDPARLLSPGPRRAPKRWLDADYDADDLSRPARLTLRPGEGPPHIRLDRAVEFLIGDRL